MRWEDMRESENVEERSGGRGIGFGGPVRLGGGAIIVIIVISLLFGKNPLDVLALLSGGGGPSVQTESAQPPVPRPAPHQPADPQHEFVARVLGDTEDVWDGIFRQLGSRYQRPKLVLFNGQVASACGLSSAAVGPFYCPGDRDVYLDLSFFQELSQRFGAPGDFARAYVIAHEVGHHVQNLLGTSDKVTQLQQRARSEAQVNDLSVRLELQADCYAGVWGFYAKQRNILDPGDLEEALGAASAIGDDRLQRESQGYVVPDSFTHGSSEQRARWVRAGFDTGDLRRCDTFSTRGL